jgi:hypothetical protein
LFPDITGEIPSAIRRPALLFRLLNEGATSVIDDEEDATLYPPHVERIAGQHIADHDVLGRHSTPDR